MNDNRSTKSVLAALTISHMTQHLYVGISVLYPSIMIALHLSYGELGLAVGVGSVLAGLLQLGPSLMCRYVSRRVLLGLGNLLYSVAEFGIGISRSFYQLFFANLIGGIGQAMQHPIAVSIISDKYRHGSVGTALGLHYGIAYLGNVIGPFVLAVLSSALGWRFSLYIFGIVPAFTGILLMVHLKSEKTAGKTPKQVSLSRGVHSSLRVKGAIVVIAAQSFLAGGTGMGGLVTYTPLFLTNQIHLTIVDVGIVFSVMMMGGVLGPLVVGRYSDRIGHLRAAIGCSLVASVSTFFLTLHTVNSLLLVIHLFVLGVSSFAITSLLQAYLSSVTKSLERDLLLGLFFTIGYGLSSIWSVVIGFVIDLYGSFRPAFQLMAILALVGALLLILPMKEFQGNHNQFNPDVING